MTLFWVLLLLALHSLSGMFVPADAQGSRKDDIVFNSRGVPLAGATVRVCAMPATGQPCTPLAQIYSDPGLTQALVNPTTTDGLGNYFFYAAPGKYEIEISGPGITTKQLPNVILPNDPSSPTFNGVTAFSLSLSGNLNVTGNTTVIGSLASGTLNLTNQGTPPGAAAAGTVNVYTKTADKRLYYKDDTGTEIGPISTGGGGGTPGGSNTQLQLNNSGVLGGANAYDTGSVFHIAEDLQVKGPNPSFDLRDFGGYSSSTSTPPSTTGSITSASTTLTLASAQDFANGQGIVIYLAGATTSLATPGQPTVTPVNLGGGSTTYSYRVVAEDRNGALTAAGTAGSTTTGVATLGANTVSLTNCSRTSGVGTYTSGTTHNLQVGAQININGFSGGTGSCNGTKTIASVPTGSTFTTSDGTVPNENNSSGGTATVSACNVLSFANNSYSGNNTIHYWIYRNNALAGVAEGVDPYFRDCGLNVTGGTTPSYVPSTPPGSAQAGYLATTIVSGGGTTTLTLATSASSTVSGKTVLHDNSANLKAAVQAAYNANGGTVLIPSAGFNYWLFNSTLDFTNGLSNTYSSSVKVHLNSQGIWINQPWIPRSGMEFEGETHATTSFQYVQTSVIEGYAYPFFILAEYSGSFAVHFSRILMLSNQPYQSAIISDSGTDGGGVAGITLENVSATGNIGSRPLIFKGGYDYFFKGGVCGDGATASSIVYCMQLTNVSPAVVGGSTVSQVPGRLQIDAMYFANAGIGIDCSPNPFQPFAVDFTISNSIFESAVAPFVNVNCAAGHFSDFEFSDIVTADNVAGQATPIIDGQNGSLGTVIWKRGDLFSGATPLVIGTSLTNVLAISANVGNLGSFGGSTTSVAPAGGFTTGSFAASGTNGNISYQMTAPSAPTTALSGASGPAANTYYYLIEPIDVAGNVGPLSTASSGITVGGSQGVLVTWTPVPGQVATTICRSTTNTGLSSFACGSGSGNPGYKVAGNSFLDAGSFFPGGSTIVGSAMGAGGMSSVGMSTSQLYETANGFYISHNTPTLTASRTYTNPDANGYLEVSSYVNSSFDNFNRANGGIGSSWTVQQNGLNVSSNQVIGTTSGGSNSAYWSTNSFSGTQFAEATITGLNGTTDYPGVTVLASSSGTNSNYYDCVENSTNIYLQRVQTGSTTNLTSAASTGNPGDVLRLEAAPGGALTCYKNGVATLTATDTTFSSGSPGLLISGSVATMDNWSGGNLHPFAHLDVEQDWTKPQHFTQGIALGGVVPEMLNNNPRAVYSAFLPSALTSTWTGSTLTLDKAVTVTRVQVQVKTAPSGCSTNAIVRISDGTNNLNVTISGSANDSGLLSQNYAAGALLTISVQTAAAGCTTSPADANVIVQYRMQ
jgi:hypothetical protein